MSKNGYKFVGPVPAFQVFKSRKIVKAGQIDEVADGPAGLSIKVKVGDGYGWVRLEPEVYARHYPAVGDWFVIYPDDDYGALSPKAAFAAGYDPL